jgi:prepilin-type processing-associated H-X9-DG protein
LPAVQAAREASRKSVCANNLKQLGIALNSYVASYNAFPGSITLFSPQTRLLEFVEQSNIFNSINFSVLTFADNDSVNFTVRGLDLSIFLCPSDRGPQGMTGMTSYGANSGAGPDANGPFSWEPSRPFVASQNVTDGASNTAAMGEWSLGVLPGVRDPLRSVFRTPTASVGVNGYIQFAAACHDIAIETALLNGPIKGGSWMTPGFGSALYNHTLIIDDHTCTNGTLTQSGAWTANSRHYRDCNVLFIDGHVISFQNSVTLVLWRAIGTMNGNELTE